MGNLPVCGIEPPYWTVNGTSGRSPGLKPSPHRHPNQFYLVLKRPRPRWNNPAVSTFVSHYWFCSGEKNMHRKGRWGRRGVSTVLFVLLVVARGRSVAADDFATAMNEAMTRMNRDMMMAPSGNPDRDFAAMMIPHHQGAIDMAKVELRFGHDPVLRRLAQGIVVAQQREIVLMQHSLATLPPAPATSQGSHTQMHMER
jgi:hypothetical protein